MIQITCPSCRTELEIDEGFRGGVCRCSNCGTLLTVPEQTQRPAQRVQRPDQPGAKPAKNVPTAEVKDESESASNKPSPQQAPSSRRKTPTQSAPQQQPATSKPTPSTRGAKRARHAARQKKSNSSLVIGLGFVIAILVLSMVLLLVMSMVRDETQQQQQTAQDGEQTSETEGGTSTPGPEQAEPVQEYDPNTNIFTTTDRMLGFPVNEGPILVIVDTSFNSRDYLSRIKAALLENIPDLKSISVQVMFGNETKVLEFPESDPRPGGKVDLDIMRERLGAVQPSNVFLPVEWVYGDAALVDPKQLIFVLGTQMVDAQLQQIDEFLVSEGVRVDMLVIDVANDPDWERRVRDLLDQTGGHLGSISSMDLRDWQREAQSE